MWKSTWECTTGVDDFSFFIVGGQIRLKFIRPKISQEYYGKYFLRFLVFWECCPYCKNWICEGVECHNWWRAFCWTDTDNGEMVNFGVPCIQGWQILDEGGTWFVYPWFGLERSLDVIVRCCCTVFVTSKHCNVVCSGGKTHGQTPVRATRYIIWCDWSKGSNSYH